MHENQLFLGRNATKKLDFVLFLEKSCIFALSYKRWLFMESRNIIGRDSEMAELQRCLDSDRSDLVIVYGRRRVGKTSPQTNRNFPKS